MRVRWSLVAIAAAVTGCGGSAPHRAAPHIAVRAADHPRSAHPRSPAPPEALVTDEDQNLLAIVNLRSLTARRFIGVPGGPQYAAAEPGVALLTSPKTGTVTVLAGDPLRVVKALHGFESPHLVAIAPDRKHAYVTDDARGTMSVIALASRRVTATVEVGVGAHHMTSSPDGRRLWVALGESARAIVIVDTSEIEHPRVIGRFDPGFAAHDLAFSPDGRRVWISAANGPDVAVFDAADHRLLFRVPVGPGPQHIAFAGPVVYLTTGYGSAVERVSARTGAVIRRVRAPYGSFEVDAGDGFVVTASLLDGEAAVYTPRLRLLRVLKIGPATRDVEISAG